MPNKYKQLLTISLRFCKYWFPLCSTLQAIKTAPHVCEQQICLRIIWFRNYGYSMPLFNRCGVMQPLVRGFRSCCQMTPETVCILEKWAGDWPSFASKLMQNTLGLNTFMSAPDDCKENSCCLSGFLQVKEQRNCCCWRERLPSRFWFMVVHYDARKACSLPSGYFTFSLSETNEICTRLNQSLNKTWQPNRR